MAQLHLDEQAGVTVLRLVGDLDGQGVADVQRDFADQTRREGVRAVVDLSGVPLVTTPGLSMFIGAAKHAREHAGALVFADPTAHVREVLRRLRLNLVLRIVEGLDDAVKAAAAAATTT